MASPSRIGAIGVQKNMKLQQLKYLLAIVDSGLNITAAANSLFTSQPGVSKQLRLLEEELGLQLFTRKGKSLDALTAAGVEVVDRAKTIIREVENIQRLASNQVDDREGRLSIATTHTQARYVLPEVISRFRERYPNVTLDLHQGTSEQIAEMVAARQIDFAIATGSRHLFGELVLLPSYRWDRSIIVPKDHALADAKTVSIQELAAFPLVTYVFSFDGHSSLRSAFEAHGLKPDVVFTARDADVIKTYVRMGLGVGIVASMAEECNETSGLVSLDASHLFPRSTTWIGFPKDTVLRNYMIDFVEMFAPHLEPNLTKEAALAADQQTIDAMVADIPLPLRGKCAEIVAIKD